MKQRNQFRPPEQTVFSINKLTGKPFLQISTATNYICSFLLKGHYGGSKRLIKRYGLEDLIQEVLLALCAKFYDNSKAAPSTHVYMVAKSRCLKLYHYSFSANLRGVELSSLDEGSNSYKPLDLQKTHNFNPEEFLLLKEHLLNSSPEEESREVADAKRKRRSEASKNVIRKKKKVYCFNNNEIYEGTLEASKATNLCRSSIYNVCKGSRTEVFGWRFKFTE